RRDGDRGEPAAQGAEAPRGERTGEVAGVVGEREPGAGRERQARVGLHQRQQRRESEPADAHRDGQGDETGERQLQRFADRNDSHTRRGVAGISKRFTPAPSSASTTAFMSAGSEPVTPASPTPFAPSG